MSASEDDLLKLASMAYDAGLDERQWTAFLEAFANAVSGCSSLLRSVDLETNVAGFMSSFGYDPAWKSAYCEHFVKLDYLTEAISRCPVGEIWSNDRAFHPSDERKKELFNDYLIPQGKRYAMGALLHKNGTQTLLLSAQRSVNSKEWGEKERRLTGALVPHVRRAVNINRKIHSVTAERDYARAALDQLRMGVVLVNRTATPLYVNRAAESMMGKDGGLAICQNRIAVHSPSETSQLHNLIANAAPGSNRPAVGGDMRISMPFNTDFIFCMVTPISSEISHRLNICLGSDCVALFLTRPAGLQLSPKRLASLYKITPAEARLTARLASLKTIEEASRELGISVNTGRTQLKSVFGKTGTRSQSELVMLLATGTLAQLNKGEGSLVEAGISIAAHT